MKFIIISLLACTAVLGQEQYNKRQYITPEAQKRASTSYATSIVHTDEKNSQAQSSVKVDFHTGEAQKIQLPQPTTNEQHQQHQQLQSTQYQQPASLYQTLSPSTSTYSHPDLLQNQYLQQQKESHATQQSSELQYQSLKQIPEQTEGLFYQHATAELKPAPHYKQALASPNPYLSALATKQYLNINPLQLQTRAPSNAKALYVQSHPGRQQLYNVGYSINIENNAPKLMYRLPNPQRNAHSYRQQKLLNGDVITGTHKDKVEKPLEYAQKNYDTNIQAASNIYPANYISVDHGKQPQYTQSYGEKQPITKIYSDVRNTHGYTWKNISPNVEISGYHSLENEKPAEPHTFDHAAALGNTQSFDISNVVENGKQPYQHLAKQVEPQVYEVNKGLSEPASSGSQITPDIGDIEVPSHTQDSSQNSHQSFDFGSLKSSNLDLFNYGGGHFQHNLLPHVGGNVEVDKSLLEGFYKNYNPIFYQPEVTLPSPVLPKNVNIKLHHSASHQVPSYQLKYTQTPVQNYHFEPTPNNIPDPQIMVNQHYAFAQVEGSKPQTQALVQPSSETKPVQEPSEDSQGQQSQQQVSVQKPEMQKEFKGKYYVVNDHKKYIPQQSAVMANSGMRYASRPVTVYSNEKNNYKMKTGLRPPPPMYIIHKSY